ncbi:intercompartmental signaling factor BofC [Caldibacillus thermolactis]|jgi:forespore regulator of the sigma-K checkpoint|uniref:Intercompartmental signaling factor BofC n=1 Tax=Pallidibacillus thermolactis TaxID=251051 RepID=A0ABT2WB33_9BACI|nr:BofC C-terminal domain-containing protein [Pallidibacillus thermolactis]MCU9592888.1 intercompartmental signaling factor BofC [Pallidibacillus thermolactis]MCU9601862.1 intercompartmental signaling factor BofC [Pallidibacillus thermolactis subsp. kokeshiiformis]MED1673759.1 BofC C-terminal domain-containing protein [Pallidibacillus thermolactis subsp. kokeshiiformis]
MKIRIFIMIVLIILAILDLFVFKKGTIKVHAENGTNIEQQELDELQFKLQLLYIDGEVTGEVIKEDVNDIEQLWNEYKDWHLVEINVDHIIFEKEINDISPVLKANGYFGLTDEGMLTVFYGKPENNNKIRSFYQIDLEKLKNIQREQLKKGIPVQSKENFQHIFNTFKQYKKTASQ